MVTCLLCCRCCIVLNTHTCTVHTYAHTNAHTKQHTNVIIIKPRGVFTWTTDHFSSGKLPAFVSVLSNLVMLMLHNCRSLAVHCDLQFTRLSAILEIKSNRFPALVEKSPVEQHFICG